MDITILETSIVALYRYEQFIQERLRAWSAEAEGWRVELKNVKKTRDALLSFLDEDKNDLP